MDVPPVPITLGQYHEPVSMHKCISCMVTEINSNLSVKKCGFLVHPTDEWLGTSPKCRVMDPTSEEPNCILGIRCPYSKQEMSQEEAYSDTKFLSNLTDSKLCLK